MANTILSNQSTQQTRDEIGQGSSQFPEIVIRRENLFFKERAYYVGKYDYTLAGSDLFVLGNSDFGVLGTNELGDTSGTTLEIIEIRQANNEFKEYFDTSEFYEEYSITYLDSNEVNTISLNPTYETVLSFETNIIVSGDISVDHKISDSSATSYLQIKITYYDDTTSFDSFTTSSESYVTVTYTNPYPAKLIKKIEVLQSTSNVSYSAYSNNLTFEYLNNNVGYWFDIEGGF
jgi:hypothetical protein